MLRRRFMNVAEKPNIIIITYYAPNRIKFGLGTFTKGLEYDENTNTTFGNVSIVLDTWNNGVGNWWLKVDSPEILRSHFIQLVDSENIIIASANSFRNNKGGVAWTGSITKLIIPEGVTDLYNTFIELSNKDVKLKEIILPNTLKRMYGTFIGNNSHNIISYIIPGSVEYVEKLSASFITESSLKEIIMEPLNPPACNNENPFGTISSNILDVKIRVFADSIDKYKNHNIWGYYNEFYDTINPYIIYYSSKSALNYNIYNYVINDNFSDGRGCMEFSGGTIPQYGFMDSLMTECYLPNSITTIKENAFYSAKNLTHIRLPDNISYIGGGTFSENVIKELKISSDYIKLPGAVIQNCKILEHIIWNVKNIDTIDKSWIYYSDTKPIAKITFSNRVEHIPKNLINNYTNISNIIFEGTISQWNSITKDDDWDYYLKTDIVHCTDGDIEI